MSSRFTIECDDEEEFRRYLAGPRALDAIFSLDNYLRELYKCQDRSEVENNLLQQVRKELRELCDEEGIQF